jgi:lipopolysaccharide transport system ATP-binding protein
MSKTVIKIENLSKRYRLGELGTGTISHDLNRWFALIRGKEDPYSLVGSINDRTQKAQKNEEIWALRNIDLEINEGEVLGIIGRNGAGKSTLLKILSRITTPTTGSYKIKGRMASLLEIGTGFHSEMTGKENIYMNGTIMGMRKREIDAKFEEIVEFAGVAKYIDTPVKRYSSGMTVRLGFAVAAHLNSEILVVDEVLAVGDAEFQKKAIGKMQDVSKGQGRTVLFVSHNMASISQLCTKGVVMNNGSIALIGSVDDSIQYYLQQNNTESLFSERHFKEENYKKFQLIHAKVCDSKFELKSNFEAEEDIYLVFTLKISEKIPGIYGYMQISRKESGMAILVSDSNDIYLNFIDTLEIGDNNVLIKIPKRLLGVGNYVVYLNFTSDQNIQGNNVDSPGNVLSFEVSDSHTMRGNRRGGFVSTLLNWEKI